MRTWKRIKYEAWWLLHNERGGGGKGGSAPQQREPSPEEVAQTQAITKMYEQQTGYGAAVMPQQIGAAQQQLAYQTGQGIPQSAGGKGGGVAPQPAGGGKGEGAVPLPPGSPSPIQAAELFGAPPGTMTSYVPGQAQQPGVAQTPWQQQLAGRGGLMGMRAQLGAGMGRPGEIGTQYGTGRELESALGGTAQFLQQRGLLKSGLMPALGAQQAGRIAERTEKQRRQEQMAMLGQGGQ